MALINCKECNAEVSSKATTCPHCGNVLKKSKRGIFGILFLWTFILFNIGMVWYSYNVLSSYIDLPDTNTGAKTVVGTIGTGILLSIWLFGAIITGLFALLTKPK